MGGGFSRRGTDGEAPETDGVEAGRGGARGGRGKHRWRDLKLRAGFFMPGVTRVGRAGGVARAGTTAQGATAAAGAGRAGAGAAGPRPRGRVLVGSLITGVEHAAIAALKAAAARGEFATDEQVRAMGAKHGL